MCKSGFAGPACQSLSSAAAFIPVKTSGKLRNTAIYAGATAGDFGNLLLLSYIESTGVRRTHFGMGHLYNEVGVVAPSRCKLE